jgi:protein-S-isoprenylcysteine O-methyltransferase Ste14
MRANPTEIPGVVAPPPLLYAIPLAVGLLAQHFWPVPILWPDIGRVAGMVLIGLGFVGFAGIVAFRRARTSPNPWKPSTTLVVSGIYRRTRNPMYLGFTLLYLGITAWVNTLWPLLPLPVVLVLMQRGVIAREEAYLEARFGDEYRRYRAAVRRWI